MRLRTMARDCLYLNWTLPRESVPEAPPPLRYEVHEHEGEEVVFASALLFRFDGLHLRGLPFPRISYPQMSLRLYVTAEDGTPAILFVRVMVPYWVVPVSRFLGRQPAQGGWFSYPNPSFDAALDATSGNGSGSFGGGASAHGEPDEGDGWVWSLRRRRRLDVHGRLASPQVGTGPDLGGWQRTIDYFRRRPMGFVLWDGTVRSLKKSHPSVPVWPMAVEMGDTELLHAAFPLVPDDRWLRLHSSWLCPEIPFTFEMGRPKLLPALPRAGRVAAPVADGC